jgi:hypothetical protein
MLQKEERGIKFESFVEKLERHMLGRTKSDGHPKKEGISWVAPSMETGRSLIYGRADNE